MNETTVSISEICKILAGDGLEPLTPRAITNFVTDGMPKASRGSYQPFACLTWYVGRLRSAVQQRNTEGADGKIISLDDAQVRLTTAKAEMEELNLALRRGELIPLYLYEKTLTDLVGVTKQRILNVPARLAQRLEGCKAVEIKALLNVTLKDALSEIARARASVKPQKVGKTPAKVFNGPKRKKTKKLSEDGKP